MFLRAVLNLSSPEGAKTEVRSDFAPPPLMDRQKAQRRTKKNLDSHMQMEFLTHLEFLDSRRQMRFFARDSVRGFFIFAVNSNKRRYSDTLSG